MMFDNLQPCLLIAYRISLPKSDESDESEDAYVIIPADMA